MHPPGACLSGLRLLPEHVRDYGITMITSVLDEYTIGLVARGNNTSQVNARNGRFHRLGVVSRNAGFGINGYTSVFQQRRFRQEAGHGIYLRGRQPLGTTGALNGYRFLVY